MNNNLEFGVTQENTFLPNTGRQTMELSTTVTSSGADTIFLEPAPYCSETPKVILEREYEIASGFVTSGGSFAFDVYTLLRTNPQVDKVVENFAYLRSDIRIRLVMNSTPLSWGMGILSWIPATTANATSLFQIENCHPTMVDISNQETVEVVIPYCSVYDAYSLQFGTVAGPTVYLNWKYVMNASAAVEAPTFKIYASFVNPVCFGAYAQSGMPTISGDTSVSTISDALSVVGAGVSILAPELAVPVAVATGMFEGAKQFVSEASALYDRSKAPEEVDTASMEIIAVRNQILGDLSGCRYGSNYQVVSHTQEKFPSDHVGDRDMDHSILSLCKLPCITQFREFTLASAPTQEIFFSPFNQLPFKWASNIDHFSNLFRYWRGSIKVRLDFFTSPLITASFMVYSWNTASLPEPLTGEKDYSMRRIVQVRGHTVCNLTIPYASVYAWQKLGMATQGNEMVTRLHVQRLMGPTSAGSNVGTVYLVVSVAAGDDFQFRSLRSPIPDISVAQSLVSQFEESLFPVLGGGDTPSRPLFDIAENSLTCEQVSLRYSSRPPSNANRGLLPDEDHNLTPTGDAIWDLFDFVQSSFRFVRGSYRLKNPLAPATTSIQVLTMPNVALGNTTFLNPGGNGIIVIDPGITPVQEMEVPFLCDLNWSGTVPFLYAQDSEPLLPIISISSTVLYVAAGRDYQLAHYMCPFLVTQYKNY